VRTLPTTMIEVLAPFAPLFSERVFQHVQLLVAGTILAPGKRDAPWAYAWDELRGEGDGARFWRGGTVLQDGLVEAHDPKGEMFGFPRLRALVAEHGEERSLGDSLLEELYSFVGEGWEQEDDIILLTLRRFSALS
jgi:hypothetical protein